MDRLAKMIDAYNDGEISIGTLERQLAFDDWRTSVNSFNSQSALASRISDNLVSCYEVVSVKTPEEIVIESERQREIIQLLESIREIIGESDFQILICRTVLNMTEKQIGDKLNKSRDDIHSVLRFIPSRIKRACELYPRYREIISKDNFLPPQSVLVAHSPETKGYPFEFLQHVNIGGSWKTLCDGRKKFVSKQVCLIPEYLKESFKDNFVHCTLCEHCTRRKDNGKTTN